MNNKQNFLKAPKISYKKPKKMPSFLDLNQLKIIINLFLLKGKSRDQQMIQMILKM